MRKKCRIKFRKGLSPFEGGYFEERFGRGDGLKAFSLDDLWGEKGEAVRGGLGGAAGYYPWRERIWTLEFRSIQTHQRVR